MKTGRHLAVLSAFLPAGRTPPRTRGKPSTVRNTQAPAPRTSATQDEIADARRSLLRFRDGPLLRAGISSHQPRGRRQQGHRFLTRKRSRSIPTASKSATSLPKFISSRSRFATRLPKRNSILAKDPDNLAARRLLARIYVRTLGDLSNTSGQHDTLARAAEQYREILRLDPDRHRCRALARAPVPPAKRAGQGGSRAAHPARARTGK